MLSRSPRASLLQRIATELSDPEQLAQRIAARERRARPDLAAAYAASRNSVEELVTGIVADVLALDRVGVNDNFFDLGGHSMLATQVLSRLRASLGADLSLSDFFAGPTVAGLAARIAETRDTGLETVAPIPRRPAGIPPPLSFAQQRLWFLDHLEPGSPAFNIPLAVRLQGRLDVTSLRRALSEVVRRHQILRSSFPSRDGGPVVEVRPPGALPLPIVDLSGLGAGEREAQSRILTARESRRPFDLARGPLLRSMLLRMESREHVLIVLLHHIAGDGWSLGVLVRELTALYMAAMSGNRRELAELPVQYTDFAHWQREWLREKGERLLSYWRGRLQGAPGLLDLRPDRPRPEIQSFRGATRRLSLDAAIAEPLKALARREGVTLFMALLAVFALLLHRRSGQKDMLIGTDVANRNWIETEGLIGFFVNQLVLRVDLSGDPTFRELLARIRQVTLEAYSHQDLPFDRLVEGLQVERSLSHPPLFQAKLILQNAPEGRVELPELTLSSIEVDNTAANLDLTLALWDLPAGLTGWTNYRTDLFSEGTIARLGSEFESLMRAATARPHAHVGELMEALMQTDKKQHQAEGGRPQPDFSKLRSMKPKAVAIPGGEVVIRELLSQGQTLPLVLRPALPGIDLVDWVVSHREALEADLLRHGGILFRGFGIDSPEPFERLASSFCSDLFNENGEHPRQSVSGKVYTPVFFPPDQQLLWHNENSFNHRWPRKIFFCCAKAPEIGGETPIVDSRQVYQRLRPELVDRFAELQVQYVRTYGTGLGLDWRAVLQIDEQEEVAGRCAEQRLQFEWLDEDRLKTYAFRPAVVRDPKTDAMSWFNQAQHWHISCLDPFTRQSLLSVFRQEELPRQCRFGDGGVIEDAEMAEVLAAYRSLEVSFPWQEGDVMMLDNLLTAHGRNPFTGERKILVAMGEMTSFDDLQA
ncbi:MAG: condensation domain-containing protein [Thermoanaerobaculia bacterium]